MSLEQEGHLQQGRQLSLWCKESSIQLRLHTIRGVVHSAMRTHTYRNSREHTHTHHMTHVAYYLLTHIQKYSAGVSTSCHRANQL